MCERAVKKGVNNWRAVFMVGRARRGMSSCGNLGGVEWLVAVWLFGRIGGEPGCSGGSCWDFGFRPRRLGCWRWGVGVSVG